MDTVLIINMTKGEIMWNKIFFGQDIVGGITKWGLFWRGVVVMIFGAVFAFKPFFTAINLGFLTGFLMALSGIWIMISAFTREEKRTAWFFYGFLLTVAGALLLYNPVAEIIFLAWCLATFFLSSGVIGISISSSISTDSVNKTFNIISCLLSILVGLFLLFVPVFAFAQLVLVTGIVLLAEGLLFVIFSFFMPKEIQQ